jgi:hypothetical protein
LPSIWTLAGAEAPGGHSYRNGRVRSRFPGSEEAALAAFRLGRLADERARDAGQALVWYDRYLDEAPAGRHGEAALARKLALLRGREGDSPAVRAAAAAYLHRHPDGPHAAEARAIVEAGAAR